MIYVFVLHTTDCVLHEFLNDLSFRITYVLMIHAQQCEYNNNI